MDTFLNFIKSKLGPTTTGIIVTLVAGGLLFFWSTKFFITAETHDGKDNLVYFAMDRGDAKTYLEVTNIKIDTAKAEKMRLENFIDISQDGKCTDRQKIRLEELRTTIQKLEIEREALYTEILSSPQKNIRIQGR